MLSVEVGITTQEILIIIILGLSTYFFPVNVLSKKKHAMHLSMRNPNGLKVIRCAACLIGINKYLAVFPGTKEGSFFNYDRTK